MPRMFRILVILLLPLALIVGCKSGSTSNSAADSGSSQSVPADPAESNSDEAPIDATCPATNTTAFAKTKFVAHSGLAIGVFHRYLWKPYQAGTFKKGAKGRITGFVKGGLAALFIKREIRLASEDVKANPTLCKAIAAPLAKAGDEIQSAFDKLKGGDTSAITDVNSTLAAVTTGAKQNGAEITEQDNANLASNPN